MKKINLILFGLLINLIFINSLFAQDNFDVTIKVGYNILKSIEGNSNTKYNTKHGMPAVCTEYYLYPFSNKNIGVGLGVGFYNIKIPDTRIGWVWTYSYQLDGSMYWTPIYGSLKYRLNSNEKFSPFVKMNHGYSFFMASKNIKIPDDRPYYWGTYGNYYLGLSTGITLGIVEFELSYNFLASKVKTRYRYSGYWSTWTEKYKTRMLTLSLGVNM